MHSQMVAKTIRTIVALLQKQGEYQLLHEALKNSTWETAEEGQSCCLVQDHLSHHLIISVLGRV